MNFRANAAPRGYSMIELIVAMAVISAGTAMLVGVLIAARHAARLRAERRLAAGLAQSALERLRAVPCAELPGTKGEQQPLPPEAKRLNGLRLHATSGPWQSRKGLYLITVRATWPSGSKGRQREVVVEGVVSDARLR